MIMPFFNPERIQTSDTLILIPFFHETKYFRRIISAADGVRGILGCRLYHFEGYDVLHGFMGYSYLLTVLEFIHNVRQKNIFFLGTAGDLNSLNKKPTIATVNEIYPGGIFRHFEKDKVFLLKKFEDESIHSVRGISVDLIQREDPDWLRETEGRGIRIVEMEIYPLMWYLKKEFSSIVVTSDHVSMNGIYPFNKNDTGKKFVEAYELILEKIT